MSKLDMIYALSALPWVLLFSITFCRMTYILKEIVKDMAGSWDYDSCSCFSLFVIGWVTIFQAAIAPYLHYTCQGA